MPICKDCKYYFYSYEHRCNNIKGKEKDPVRGEISIRRDPYIDNKDLKCKYYEPIEPIPTSILVIGLTIILIVLIALIIYGVKQIG